MNIEEQSLLAWEAVEAGDIASARNLAEQLIEQEASYGYLVMALTYGQEEEYERAIEELQRGVERFPDSWRLYMQLGNYYSDTEDYPAALQAFEEALNCSEVEAHWVQMNQAVVYIRQENIDQGLNLLQQLQHPEVLLEAFELKLSVLSSYNKAELLLELAEEELETLPVPEDEQAAAAMARICIYIAKAGWDTDAEEAMIRHYLREAIFYDRTNEEILWLMREINPQFSDDAKVFGLLVVGTTAAEPDTGEDGAEFNCIYSLVADTAIEGLDFIREFEPTINPDSLQILDQEETENEEDLPKGLYMVGELLWME